MATFGDLVVRLSLDKRPFDRGASGVQSSLKSLATFAGGAAAGFTAVIGAATAAGVALYAFVKPAFEAIDANAKLADRLGITMEALSGLQHIANLSGVSTELLTASIQKMQINLSDAAMGIGSAKEAFAQLGINAAALMRIAPEDQFAAIADALAKIPNNADRLRILTDIFGRGAGPLLNVLMEGGDSIRAMADEAERLGLAVSRVDAAKIEAANDAWTRVDAAVMGLKNTLAIKLAPTVEAIANAIVEFGPQGVNAINSVADAIRSSLIPTMEAVATAVGFLFPGMEAQITKLLNAAKAGVLELAGGQDKADVKKKPGGVIAPDEIAPGIPAPIPDFAAGVTGSIKGIGGGGLGAGLKPQTANDQLAGGAVKGSREALERILKAGQRQKDPLHKTAQQQLTVLTKIEKGISKLGAAGGQNLGDI